ncbi:MULTISPECIES: type III secretion system protein SctP [unclassified Cupriavidus]|uniref:type III secretion system protein SctP n=1 Tax=unclassified Cupriavidus TaxID=2640874 RepID=UPI001AEB0BEC|nr:MULTISPECIES: type III secretion system protein SctP [unclassified Cupriavidus]MBP0633592.1 type III secretion system protein SctP [Cupriavidus sp. AcVe19-1a]MBP0640042.1 type III secretion system protein SctP [Cupriavidus sp. AcVe19-6a]
MTLIEPRPLRIIASNSDQRPTARVVRARPFDYAVLVRRPSAPRASVAFDRATPETQADHSCEASDPVDNCAHVIPFDDGRASDSNAHVEATAEGEAARESASPLAAHEALLQRLPATTMPAVDVLFRTRGHFLELARSLAWQVAAFCANPAIGNAGNWEVSIPLDARILPDTTLYLSLSRFWLSLRFDTPSIGTRQLLFDHSAVLERDLAALLNAWGTPREIELTVW